MELLNVKDILIFLCSAMTLFLGVSAIGIAIKILIGEHESCCQEDEIKSSKYQIKTFLIGIGLIITAITVLGGLVEKLN
jgi:hypothetical protein